MKITDINSKLIIFWTFILAFILLFSIYVNINFGSNWQYRFTPPSNQVLNIVPYIIYLLPVVSLFLILTRKYTSMIRKISDILLSFLIWCGCVVIVLFLFVFSPNNSVSVVDSRNCNGQQILVTYKFKNYYTFYLNRRIYMENIGEGIGGYRFADSIEIVAKYNENEMKNLKSCYSQLYQLPIF